VKKVVFPNDFNASRVFGLINLVDRPIDKVEWQVHRVVEVVDVKRFLVWHRGCDGGQRLFGIGRSRMKTLVIGMVIAVVFLATYFVSTMQQVW